MKNLSEILKSASQLVPDKGIIHISSKKEDYFQSYKQLYKESKNIAFLLRTKGFNKGDILILSVDKSEDFTQLFWGCILAGIIPAPMPSIKYKEESSVLFNRLDIAADYLNAPLLLTTDEAVVGKLRERKRVLIDADMLLKHSHIQDFDFIPNEADKDSLAVIQFSSGSTGDPKGVMLSHRNILANMELKKKFDRITAEDILIHWMPYYHDYGLFGNHISSIYNRIHEIRIDTFSYLRNPLLWLKKITQYKATISSSTATGLEILLQKMSENQQYKIDLSTIKVLSIGAEMVPPGLKKKVLGALLPLGFSSSAYCPGYGLAEATLIVSGTDLNSGYRSLKIDRKEFVQGRILVTERGDCEFVSVGKPIDHNIQIRIVKKGEEQGPLHLGSIQIKGDCVMQGYYNNSEATQNSFTADGWFNTGDIGFFDFQMNLYITGRHKEIIIVNGQNHFPFDLESCIMVQKGDHIEKSIFTSYYSNEEEREIVLHFFVLKKQELRDDIETIVKELISVVSMACGVTPDVSICIRKGEVPKTSSSKIMRNQLVKNYLDGKYRQIVLISNIKHKNNNNIEKYSYKNTLVNIWVNVLELDTEKNPISLKSNFFALGGDSMRAIIGVSELEEICNIKLENSFFYKYPTLEMQMNYFQSVASKIVVHGDEYELLLRELICDQLGITYESLGTTDNLISKIKSTENFLSLIDYLTEIFCLSVEEKNIFQKKTTIKQIATFIRAKYHINEGMPFPLMDFQETLYYHSHNRSFLRNEPTGLSCYIICRMSIKGNFQKEYFDQAFNFVIDSNPVLHSVISEDTETPSMVTLETYPKFVSVYKDISHLPQQEQNVFFETNDQADHDHRFDLTQYPLFYSHIFKTNAQQHEVVIHIDHQLMDGYSFFCFLRDIIISYDQFADKKTISSIRSQQLQFSDYVQLERLKSKTINYGKTMDFALNVFKDIPEKITLPLLQNPSLLQAVHFNTYHTQIDSVIMSSISDIVKSNPNLSMNALLLACYFKLMNIWSGQEDLIINMPIYNREQHFPTAKKVMGSFLDIFPVRIQAKPNESIIAIAQKVELFIRTMLKYPVSSIDLTRKIAEQSSLKQGSLSPIIFSNSINIMPEGLKNLSHHFELDAPKMQTGAPGTYIDLVMFTWERGWYFDWNYVRELFSKEFIETLSWQFISMLKHLAEIKDDPSALVEYTGSNIIPEKYKQLYSGINATTHEYPQLTIDQWINRVRKIDPNKEAICFEDVHLSYDQYYKQATQLAHLLRNLGVGPNKSVALLMNRSHDLPIAQLAILIAGGAYVPIDPDYPVDRVQYMLEDCGATILISQNIHCNLMDSAYTEKIRYCILLGEQSKIDLKKYKYKLYTTKDIMKYPFDEIPVLHSPEDLIYIIYTSGSTGQPKGTMLRHRNVCNFLYYVQTAFHVTAQDRFAFITSYSFDMTVTSNWLPFITGASLSILSEEKTKDVEQLLLFISNQKISFLNITPSHFSLLTNILEFSEQQLPLEQEMTVMLGAEIINVSDVNKWISYYPTHKLINEYGPTETTVASTFYPIPLNNQNQCELRVVPIGKPIYNTQVYILNENKEQCLPGVPGTLYIGGEGVSLGYLNQKEKTENVFIPNPLSQNVNDIVYNTGDLAKFTETGDIIFIGRKDFQVNVRGYRIELREIEYALSKILLIAETCADVQFDGNNQATIVAFYTTKTGTALDNGSILESLEKQLPQYMIPSVILHIDKIPITTNGKVDKKALPNIASSKQLSLSNTHVPPKSALEKQLAMLWSNTMDLSPIGIHDNFWDIGGDSLSSVYLLTELRDAGFKNIKLRHIFDYPTVATMADYINKDIFTSEDNIVDIQSVTDADINLFCLPYAAGTAAMYTKFVQNMPDSINIQSAQYPGHGDTRQLVDSVSDTGDLYVSSLRKTSNLYLLGYSYGGYIAYDICKKLEEEGIRIAGIIMVGTTPPNMKDDLMTLFSSEDRILMDQLNDKDIMNQAFLETLLPNERDIYINQLKNDTMAMLQYQFSLSKLKTPLLSIIGENEEAVIKDNQRIWEKYFETVHYKTLKGGHLLIKEYHKELADTIELFMENTLITQL